MGVSNYEIEDAVMTDTETQVISDCAFNLFASLHKNNKLTLYNLLIEISHQPHHEEPNTLKHDLHHIS